MPTNPPGVRINGFPMYSIDKGGRVWSVSSGEWKELKRIVNAAGYEIVNLMKDGEMYNKRVHQIVATHYIKNPNNFRNVLHKDGNKTNNSARNLYWGTTVMNSEDARKHKTMATGQRHGRAVLNWAKVRLIRRLRVDFKWTYIDIAQAMGCCKRTAMMVCKYQTWKDYPLTLTQNAN